MPLPTMFRNAGTGVLDLSMTSCLNCAKSLAPDEPVSTAVVTPERKVKPSGATPCQPLASYCFGRTGPLLARMLW